MKLSRKGEQLRQALGAAGFEITPSELIDSVTEAGERIRPGPDGCCTVCGESGREDYRFGVCDVCAFCTECDEWAEELGPTTRCEECQL